MFGYIYQLVLVWDALRMKNTIQIIGLCFYNVGIIIYAAIQMDQIKDAANYLREKDMIHPEFWDEIKPILIALPCLMALGTIMLSFAAWKLYDEFAWTIYKHISADLRLKRRYLVYQVRALSTHTPNPTLTHPRSTSPSSSLTSSSSSASPSNSSSSSRTPPAPSTTSPSPRYPSPSSSSSSPPTGPARSGSGA
jgi:hypothetical protein